MKKFFIPIVVLVLIIVTLIVISFTNKNDLTELNDIINLYYEIINPDKINLNNNFYRITGTLNEKYHYIDAHGGKGFSYDEEINYEVLLNDNIYLKLNDIKIKLENEYINYYIKLLNINNINIDNNNYKRHIYYLEYDITDNFNNIFNSNYNKVILKKYHNKYLILFDNKIILINNSNIIYSIDNNIVCTISFNNYKNNIDIKFNDNNSINIIKENNNNFRYNFLINNIPFYIIKKDNNYNFIINYIARKYNDFNIKTEYKIDIIDNIDDNLYNEDKINNFAIYEYIKNIKELNK